MAIKAFRSSLLHFLTDPKEIEGGSYEYFEDGLLVVEGGKVARSGEAKSLLPTLPAGVKVEAFPDCLIVPGLIDTHTHFAQMEVIASPASDTLDWLNRYTFPAERRCEDMDYAAGAARSFLGEMLKRGTTTALVFGTVHKSSAEAIFREAENRNLRLIAGKVLMDRNAPDFLRDTPEKGYADTKELIEKWHGRKRLEYAITPRFAPTSSPEQLAQVRRLLEEHPTVPLQTHLSETPNEVAWVKELFPKNRSYLEVYEQYGMCRPRAVFAHSIYLDDPDWKALAKGGAAVSFCPTSNLFLGSGLFDLARADRHGVKVALGTDVGGGTSFSLLRTMSEAQKVCAMKGMALSGLRAWYLATLGGASALGLQDKIGNFLPGKEADFAVMDLASPPLLERRLAQPAELGARLFALMTLAEESTVKATYVLGERA